MLDTLARFSDAIMAGGLFLVVGYVVLAGYDLMALKHAFSPMSFGGGAMTILGAIGTAAAARDRLFPVPPPKEGVG